MEKDSSQVYESLYNQAKSLKEKKEQQTQDFIKKHCSFKPNITKASSGNVTIGVNSQDFLKRQSVALENRERKIHK